MKKTVKTQSDRIKKFIKMGNNSSILLLALIDDILDLSKMEAGTFTIHNDDFSIGVLLDEVEDIFNTQCEQKGIRFNIDIGDEVDGAHLWSDKGRIKQVLLNLISNAVKFTFAGSITITVRKEVRDNNCVVVFVISDSGIGIKDDDQKQLFSLFGMISEVQVLNPNGTGIGLTVCQKYVEKLGGTIKLESKYGKGTDVTFWIPNIEKKPIKKIKEIMGLSPPIKNKKSKGNLLFNIEYESLFVIAREDGKINTPVSRKVNSNCLKRFMF
jgi:signal transduction histidine kinase